MEKLNMRNPIFKILFYKILLLLLFPNHLFAQTIVGGPLSPDLKNIKQYSLVEMIIKSDKPPTSIDWSIYTINKDIITSISSFQCVDKCIFTGPPGNYLVHCNIIIDNKISHADVNITIPGIPNPNPNPNPNPPITTKIFAAMVADTSNNTYLQSPQAFIWASTTIVTTLKTINVTWKHYDINSQISNGKGTLIPLKNAPWGAAAVDIITKTNGMPALVLINNDGTIITTISLPSTEEETVNFIKGKLNR